jgi:hypothetical protein
MHLPHYPIIFSESRFAYEFVSEGPRGRIRKAVAFAPTMLPRLYNLAMGDLNEDSSAIDDTVRSDNGDRDLVLSTVAGIVYHFCLAHPHLMVTATGSTEERTRLYRMGITKNLAMLQEIFYIFGLRNNEWQPFEKSVDYDAFLVALKPNFRI